MGLLLANNASATVTGTIIAAHTTIYLDDASSMPNPGAGEWFNLTLTQPGTETSWEVVKCTSRAGNTLTVVRGQDGTTAAGWASGTVASVRANAGTLWQLAGGMLGQLSGPEITIGGSGDVALRGAYPAAASSVGGVAVQTGDIILVYWCSNNTLSSPTCSDGTDTYTQKGAGQYVAATGVQSHLYWARASTSGTRTVTVADGGASSPTIHVQVISGAVASGDPIDAYSFTTTAPGGSTATTSSITPTADGAFISTFFAEDVTSATTFSVGSSGFTLASSQNATDCFSNSFYRVQAAAAAISMTAAINTPTYAATCIVSVKAATAAAASSTIGRMHVCAGTTANYAVALPAVAGNAGRFIGFRMAPGLTKLVTLTGNSTETIDGSNTRIMWANEAAVLYCDGATWTKVGGKSIPMNAALGVAGNQTFANGTLTALTFTQSAYLNAPAAMQDLASSKLVILRPGRYIFAFRANPTGNNTSACNVFLYAKSATLTLQGTSYLPASNSFGFMISEPLNLSAGEYLTPYGYYSAGSFTTTFLSNDSATHVANVFSLTEIPTW